MKQSELRQDPVSGDWILFAPGRIKRPDDFVKKRKGKRKPTLISKCPFENPFRNRKMLLRYGSGKEWEIVVFENDYPAVGHSDKLAKIRKLGPSSIVEGFGHHDLVVTRNHYLNFPELPFEKACRVFETFRDRYLMLLADRNLAYVSIFQNWGPLAGATVSHPHFQIIAIPVVPPDIGHSLRGSARYFKEHKTCVHCTQIKWELKEKKRVIVESAGAVAITPFVSRNPFEVRVFSKKHLPYFENSLDGELCDVVAVLQKVLRLIRKNLGDPDYNFFIHTAPIRGKEGYHHYHWHIEIYPKMTTRAGFEFGTGIDINVIDPDVAAKILRRK